MKRKYTIELSKVGLGDINLVGGKNASLGEMISNLTSKGIKVPNGYAVTVEGYWEFIYFSGLKDQINQFIEGINFNDLSSLEENGKKIRDLILQTDFPPSLEEEIMLGLEQMKLLYPGEELDLAVRSSATAEDLPDASFAGQQETYLNVRGKENLLQSIKKCFASLFTNRAISYRFSNGFHGDEVALSVTIQKMVRSDVGVSGVAFSVDTESGYKDAIIINGTFGLGELLVQGAISPDEFIVHKTKIKEGFNSILEKKLGSKERMLMYSNKAGTSLEELITPQIMKETFCLSDKQIIQLAKWVTIIEEYYSNLHGKWCPVDIEWAIDGNSKDLFIVQARPETVRSQENQNEFKKYTIQAPKDSLKNLIKGIAVGDGVGQGKAKIYKGENIKISSIKNFNEGDILVTDMTDPDWEPLMKKASAIVTNKGGRTCHAAIVARELGVPAVVGTVNATETLKDYLDLTVSCCEGTQGNVYEGVVDYEEQILDLTQLPSTRTNVMLNIGSPDLAFKYSNIPNNGVGLARQEFIFNNYVKVHPLALVNHKEINDPNLTTQIEKLIVGYENEEDYFIQKLSQGIAKIAASFSPNNVILRLSDFKSNEYANLLGGKYYEPKEENPMIGWRGASRYYSADFSKAFELECKAISRVRTTLGFNNLSIMIPFCRTVEECSKVISTMAENGLIRGENNLKIYLMAEVPSNIILAEKFAKYIDGFSIGSNDLTQLTLGLDRDSELVSHLFDENNEAVKEMIKILISKAKKCGVTVGICGQAPSDHPHFAEFLVRQGIDSISVTPDSLFRTVHSVAKIEKELTYLKISKAA